MTNLNNQLNKSDPLKEEDNSEEEQWRRFVNQMFFDVLLCVLRVHHRMSQVAMM